MLAIKPNQNLIIDLDASRYNALIRPLIECLKCSPLMKALTMSEYVPLINLSKSFFTAIYNMLEDVINFEVLNHKTSISKPDFCKLLGLVMSEVSVILNRFLPPIWSRCSSEWATLVISLCFQSLVNFSYLQYGMDYLIYCSKGCQKGFLVLTVQAIISTPWSMGYTMVSTWILGL